MISIVTPASSVNLTTVDKLMDAWRGEKPSIEEAELAISAASITIGNWCRRGFVKQDYLEVLQAPFRQKLVLSESPIDSVTSVEIDGDAVTDYTINSSSGILLRTSPNLWTGTIRVGGPFCNTLVGDDPHSIEVEYTAGWITREMDEVNMDLPADVEKAAIVTASEMLKLDTEKPVGTVLGVKVGGFSSMFSDTDTMTGSGSGYWAEAVGDPSMLWLPLSARRALMHYRRRL